MVTLTKQPKTSRNGNSLWEASPKRAELTPEDREDRNYVQTLSDRLIKVSKLLFLNSEVMSNAKKAGCAHDLKTLNESITALKNVLYRARRKDLVEAAHAIHTAWLHDIRDGTKHD